MISISKYVGALALCVAHKMEDKMEKNREKKTKRKWDGGGGDEKYCGEALLTCYLVFFSANRQIL